MTQDRSPPVSTTPTSPASTLRTPQAQNLSAFDASQMTTESHTLASSPAHPASSTFASPSPRSSLGSPSKPAGPRSPDLSKAMRLDARDQPGSLRTRYYAPRANHPTSPIKAVQTIDTTPSPSLSPPTRHVDIDMEDHPHTRYRSPEPVIEPPEEHPPGYIPGVIGEHPSDDDMASPDSPPAYANTSHVDTWTKSQAAHSDQVGTVGTLGRMDIDTAVLGEEIERPQIGPGSLPRRLLELVHEHELFLPSIPDIPLPPDKKPRPASDAARIEQSSGADRAPPSPAPSVKSASLPDYDRLYTLADVHESMPGGSRQRGEWYFCPVCWGWIKISVSREPLEVQSIDDWEAIQLSKGLSADELIKAEPARLREAARWNDLIVSRTLVAQPSDRLHHFHEFRDLMSTYSQARIERVQIPDEMNAFPHRTLGMDEDKSLTSYKRSEHPARLFMSCSSSHWVIVEDGMIPGQLPDGLVKAFTSEKMDNPGPGQKGSHSAMEAWTLISELLYNPLFRGQRGWVQLENKKFKNKIGTTILSSNVLHQMGFACRQDEDALRVGPLNINEEKKITQAEVEQMDRYMMRTWVEVGIFLAFYKKRHRDVLDSDLIDLKPLHISVSPIEDVLRSFLDLPRYPQSHVPIPGPFRDASRELGVTAWDAAYAIETAYSAQIACDAANTKSYLSALDRVSFAPIAGRDALQTRVAMERSLDRYTIDDLRAAYSFIGFTTALAEDISVEPQEAPDDYILELHKKSVQAAPSASARSELGQALSLIGRDRKSETMMRLGGSGGTMMSVDEAYSALSAPRDSIDDGLIMQYEMAIIEYPGRKDHYQMCLEIIANADGEERPGIKTFLATGAREPEQPARLDIPVGLHNIGNTCYLNSILQYLYSIKPLRDAVMTFEQASNGANTPFKPEVERSRRFVRELRLLFLQLYRSETPSVRPDEQLAYLAITRPEIDQIVEPPVATKTSVLDSIPNIPSPSSTRVATPDSSPRPIDTSPPGSPSSSHSPHDRESSVLGKRASTDRDDSSGSSVERTRHKSDGFDELDKESDDFELVRQSGSSPPKRADTYTGAPDSPSAVTDLGGLKLRSPEAEEMEGQVPGRPDGEDVVMGGSPTVPPPLPPRPPVTRKDTLASGLKFGLQQDSAEVLINVLSQLEMAFHPSTAEGQKGSNIIQKLFSCKFRQQTFYENPASLAPLKANRKASLQAQSPVESVFTHPIIGVEEEGKDLYDCLGELYLRGAEIEYEGRKGVMMDLMDEFPELLYIQMRRSQYDLTTGREIKTNTHIAFDRNLAMDRFLVDADAQKRNESIDITREMARVRGKVHQLKHHKPLSIPDTFKHVQSALASYSASVLTEMDLNLNADFMKALNSQREEVEAEIRGLEDQLPVLKRKLEGLWTDSSKWEYELVSVFMHRGRTSGAGHYWTYQSHLPSDDPEFFKYNDETVTRVPASEVLQDRTGSDANPALLCYVRKGRSLVDTLHREILVRESGVL